MGVEKAEIVTALCSMLHGPLAKVDNQAFASIKSVIDSIAANPVFMQYADSIAQLFLDRFRWVRLRKGTCGKKIIILLVN